MHIRRTKGVAKWQESAEWWKAMLGGAKEEEALYFLVH